MSLPATASYAVCLCLSTSWVPSREARTTVITLCAPALPGPWCRSHVAFKDRERQPRPRCAPHRHASFCFGFLVQRVGLGLSVPSAAAVVLPRWAWGVQGGSLEDRARPAIHSVSSHVTLRLGPAEPQQHNFQSTLC